MTDSFLIINEKSLKEIIQNGEDSTTEFKESKINKESLVQGVVAFLNKSGGRIIFGVDDKKNIVGVEDAKEIENLILNIRAQIRPIPTIFVTNHIIDKKLIIYLNIPHTENKPYSTNDGRYFIRHGASKRIMSQEELQRAFQSSKKVYAEEIIIPNSTIVDINIENFKIFYKKRFEEVLDIEDENNLKEKIEVLKCSKDGLLTYLGALLFCDRPQTFLPSFNVQAIAFKGKDITGNEYRSSESIDGDLKTIYKNSKNFIISNIPKIQKGQTFNSLGLMPFSEIALEELLVNAFIHRDYFINAPIRIFIFDDRIEIKSPGKLPNGLTIENIEESVPIRRNQILYEYVLSARMLSYRGVGSGIKRAKKEQVDISFVNDDSGIGEFTAVIPLFQSKPKKIKHKKTTPIMPDIRVFLNLLIASFNDLKTELIDREPILKEDLHIIEYSLDGLEEKETLEEIIKSGSLIKVERFIKKLNDNSTKLGKAIRKIDDRHQLFSDLSEKYNKLADFLGFQKVSEILLV